MSGGRRSLLKAARLAAEVVTSGVSGGRASFNRRVGSHVGFM